MILDLDINDTTNMIVKQRGQDMLIHRIAEER